MNTLVNQPRPQAFQYLHDLKNAQRYFICRNKTCHPEYGNYYSTNTQWINTVKNGGWHFMCPICNQRYQPNKESSKLNEVIPANFLYYVKSMNRFMLGEWPNTRDEIMIEDMLVTIADEKQSTLWS